MVKESSSGFSIIEVVSTVTIIAIVFAIAMSGYASVRNTSRKTVCVANLEKIDAAIDQWTLENHVSDDTAISGSEEEIYNDYIRSAKPKCPASGEYTLHTVGTKPQVTCSKEGEGHKLP